MVKNNNIFKNFPTINKDELVSIKNIRSGEHEIRLNTLSKVNGIIINDMSLSILNNCNGKNSVMDICKIIQSEYKVDDIEMIYHDVDILLNELYRLQVIYFKENNYLLEQYVVSPNKHVIMKYLQLSEAVELSTKLKDDLIYAYLSNSNAKADLVGPNVTPYNWYDLLTGYFNITNDEDQIIANSIVIPEPKICGFRIFYLDIQKIDVFNTYKEEFFRFIYTIYKNRFGIEVVNKGESVYYLFTTIDHKKYDTIFDYLGKCDKEINGQTVYWYYYSLE